MDKITGRSGITGDVIANGSDESEETPEAFVTMKVYDPAVSPDIVVLVPVPVVVTVAGLLVKVHPSAGKPLNTTLPVEGDEHVGCITVSTIGATIFEFTVNVVNFETVPPHPPVMV